ncbi:division/cell wall cluster transcriptional repressor MraZ [Desulfovibrio inopinatus]|uniref:division/cell wall cluster transcriptional repressor MraZ n=1 Tax=Desulfovibrio inopinatus TaxID=102109 RepID=UPI00048915C0|nr:division/cell wall cluster transcriptional repressor MraZ [Desulfovibrio inopinatus]
MFRGHSYRNLDAKGRLMLPPEFRETVFEHSPEGKLMLTNFDGAVAGYPMPEWQRIEESFERINILNAKVRNLQRFIISGAVEITLDKQGRILIPPHLRNYAKLEKDVVLAGVIQKFEIWDMTRFEERRRLTEENFDDDMASLADEGFELRL